MITDSESRAGIEGRTKRDAPATTVSIWLALAITALTISSAYVVVIVFVRSGFSQLINQSETFFQTALVLHVDFALVVWLLSMGAALWSLHARGRQLVTARLEVMLGCAGIVLMLLSPLLGADSPVISDYLLLLDHPLFLVALALFIGGVTLSALRLLIFGNRSAIPPSWSGMTAVLLRGSALAFLWALLLFFITLWRLPAEEEPRLWYGSLFWGAGHLLQFSYLFLLLAAWSGLLQAAGMVPRLSARHLAPFLWVLISAVLSAPLFFLLEEENAQRFTELMEFGGTVAFLMLLIVLVTGFKGGRKDSAAYTWVRGLLKLSFLLFALGTLCGFLITENNALVPAHYHGMMGAVTLSLMGGGYLLGGRLGMLPPSHRLITLQARLYAGGLGLVMTGLIVSDVPRKALEADATGEFSQLAGRSLIAIGGAGALLGTVIFVILMWRGFHRVVAATGAKGLEIQK